MNIYSRCSNTFGPAEFLVQIKGILLQNYLLTDADYLLTISELTIFVAWFYNYISSVRVEYLQLVACAILQITLVQFVRVEVIT